MHSIEYVRRQALADATLQERVGALAEKGGQTFAFDAAMARGDAALRRLLLMEAANTALGALLEATEEATKPARKRTE